MIAALRNSGSVIMSNKTIFDIIKVRTNAGLKVNYYKEIDNKGNNWTSGEIEAKGPLSRHSHDVQSSD